VYSFAANAIDAFFFRLYPSRWCCLRFATGTAVVPCATTRLAGALQQFPSADVRSDSKFSGPL